MDHAAYCTLEVVRSSLSSRVSPKGASRSLLYECNLRGQQRISLPDKGRDISKVLWSLEVIEGALGAQFVERNACGIVTHHDEHPDKYGDDYSPEVICAWANVPVDVFEVLMSAQRSGDRPVFVLGVRGLNYGWEPDGSGKEWDLSARRSLELEEMIIRAGSLGPPKDDPEDEVFVPAQVTAPVIVSPPAAAPTKLTGVYWLLAAILAAILLK